MYGTKENLIPSGMTMTKLFLAKDFKNAELPDAALECLQSANAYRDGDDPTPGPFGADAPLTSDDEAMALAAELDAEPEAFGAADGAEAIDPEKRKKFKKLALWILTTVLPLVL